LDMDALIDWTVAWNCAPISTVSGLCLVLD
jgi:hypothetical protein